MDDDFKIGCALFVGCIGLILVVVLFVAHQEAATFRKLTGRTDVTTWDALWVNLRVDDD